MTFREKNKQKIVNLSVVRFLWYFFTIWCPNLVKLEKMTKRSICHRYFPLIFPEFFSVFFLRKKGMRVSWFLLWFFSKNLKVNIFHQYSKKHQYRKKHRSIEVIKDELLWCQKNLKKVWFLAHTLNKYLSNWNKEHGYSILNLIFGLNISLEWGGHFVDRL